MVLIVGLGNPGKLYENTFHNLGFLAVDLLAKKLNKEIKKYDCQSLVTVLQRNGEKIVIAKPTTFMNLSGNAVKSLCAKYGATPDDIFVLYDDFEIPRFTLRARAFGSGGTHNGMKSVVSVLGTESIKRIRIGMGDSASPKKDFVLSPIPKDDMENYAPVLTKLADALIDYIANKDIDLLMRTLN
ncbi:MAG: aminoacyl-tRNA hydrolase [Firmicutes bacterium]|nr:aminoacyl-tRNA hydrolase [Bacillota bacterium]